MKRLLAAFSFAILALAATAQQTPQAVDDKQFSLNKGNVLEAAHAGAVRVPGRREDGPSRSRARACR